MCKVACLWQETLLGGALQFLAEIGEDISVSIPDRQLHDGDFIEIERQVSSCAFCRWLAGLIEQPPSLGSPRVRECASGERRNWEVQTCSAGTKGKINVVVLIA